MKAWVIVLLLCCGLHYGMSTKGVTEQNQNLNESQQSLSPYTYQKVSDDFRPVSGGETNENEYDFNVDDNVNEISKGPFYPIYQPLTNPSTPSAISTHLKQVSNNYPPMSTMNSPTPVWMQYVPSSMSANGLQYMQFIPSRPLIVPINSYFPQNSGGFTPQSPYPSISSQSSQSALTPSSVSSLSAALGAYGPPRPMPTLSTPSTSMSNSFHPPMEISYPVRSLSTELSPPDISSLLPPSPSSAVSSSSSIQSSHMPSTYRYVRPNAGLELINMTPDLGLNTNEYVPPGGMIDAGTRTANGRQ